MITREEFDSLVNRVKILEGGITEPPPTGEFAYFDSLVKHPNLLSAHSLRNAEQVRDLIKSENQVITCTYDPVNDKDPRKQDACKIVVQAGDVSLKNGMRATIPDYGNKNLFVIWDSWMGAEFAFNKTGIGNWKHFQFASGRIWTEIKSNFSGRNNTPPEGLAAVEVRLYGQFEDIGPNITNRHPLSPTIGEFTIQPEEWTRYFVLFNPNGEWYEFSLWVADKIKGVIQIHDKLLIKPNSKMGYWNEFWYEYNSSATNHEIQVERVSYVRNLVMLSGIEDVQSLLVEP